MAERGKYIVIEGNDGTGKSTQVGLLRSRLERRGAVCSEVHEPDGPPAAAELRKIIKNGNLERDSWTNVMLFTAARRISWLQQIQPALERGEHVLAARNWFSTVVYQGYGQGEDIAKIEQFTRENVSEEYLQPDLAIVLTLGDAAIRQARISARGELENPDTFESMPDDFQMRVNNGYVEFAKQHRLDVIDASVSVEEVEKEIWKRIAHELEVS